MNRYERRVYFERLCELRDRAAHAGPRDRQVVCSVAEVIDWASALMAALEAEEAVTAKASQA